MEVDLNSIERLYLRFEQGRREGRFVGAFRKHGEVLQAIRDELGFNRKELAKLSGVSAAWLYRLEKSPENEPPSRRTIRAILEVYLRQAPGKEAERIRKANGYIDCFWEIGMLTNIEKVCEKLENNFGDLHFS